MAVNRFFRRTPYDLGLYTPPTDVIRESMAMAQKQYDTNFLGAEAIKNTYINSLPQDRQRANELQSQWNQAVEEAVASAQGDYSRIGKQLTKLTSDIRKQLSPGGEANAIVSNFSNYQNWLKEHQDRVAKGNVLGEDLNLANNYFMSRYQGVGQIDPVTGEYNRFNPDVLPDYADPNKIIQDTFKEFKPEKHKVGTSYVKDGYVYHDEQEVEGISAQRLLPSFQTALISDPKYATYLQARAKYTGAGPDGVKQFIGAYATQRANDLAYMNRSSDSTMKADEFAVAKYKAGLDKQNMMEVMSSFLEYGPAVPSNETIAPTFNPDDWRNGLGIQELNKPGMFPMSIGLFPDKDAGKRQTVANQGLMASQYGIAGIVADNKTSLNSFLSDKGSEAKIRKNWNINPNLVQQMWEDKKRDFAGEYNAKYGKDPKWTAEFERNFMYDLKKEAPNHSTYQTLRQEVPAHARDNALNRALRLAISGGAATYQPGSAIQNVGLPKDILDFVYDSQEGKLKNLDALNINVVVPGAGYGAAGFEISTPKGRVVVVDPNVSRSQYSQQMSRALNPILQEGRKRGADVIAYRNAGVGPDGSARVAMGVPELKFERVRDPNSGQQFYEQSYYMTERDGSPIIENGKQAKASLGEMQQLMLPAFGDILGYGQTKAAATPFQYFFNSN